ncbi:gamma-glutamyl-gamma-aminobutyrate hydrolase [Oceanimonas sp. CAM02]|uniref:gamma-glutamyl-gamma-aminobutyrate hydrolase n=1 Tax=Oceanimonas sp. CAM02 TaxID=3080336 RepID=UPI00293645DE|nr:gamma-glutamyl-gamma-aminobutyrate hydrolase [Oceanimonas sp. CAM02]MDV2856246.1 gamma-glutamyl-gamma-aminobutyrate hydrolase [Oceanimonas sp. CAM02]
MSMVYIFNKPWVGVILCQQQLGPHVGLTVQQKYLDAIVAAGAVPVPLVHQLGADEQSLDAMLARLDGILLTGSYSNMEPHHYGETGEEAHTDKGRDRLSLRLIAAAQSMKMPLFGICRGFQEMVVASGGSLHRRLHETGLFAEHRENKELPLEQQYAPAHSITPVVGGVLARLAGDAELNVNSLHMQGAKSIGPGVQVEATAPDGLVEAISLVNHPFALGVQWHPEWQSRENPLSRALFDGFVAACHDYAGQRSRG